MEDIYTTQGGWHDFGHLLKVNPAMVFEWPGLLVGLDKLCPLLFHLRGNVSTPCVTPSPARLALDSLDSMKDAANTHAVSSIN